MPCLAEQPRCEIPKSESSFSSLRSLTLEGRRRSQDFLHWSRPTRLAVDESSRTSHPDISSGGIAQVITLTYLRVPRANIDEPISPARPPLEVAPLRGHSGSSNLTDGETNCVGEFRTTFRTIPASVAQWIEQRFPKPQVAGSIPAGGATLPRTTFSPSEARFQVQQLLANHDAIPGSEKEPVDECSPGERDS